MPFSVIIPARYASTRLPGKPLLDIGGKPMIQQVYERAQASQARSVIVATDHTDIAQCVRDFGGAVCLTGSQHESGTDRLQEVVEQLELPDDAIIVNVQGDEPLLPAAVINQVAANLAANPSASVATLCEPISQIDACFNPNTVKVVASQAGFALYFSRAPIPWHREAFSEQPAVMPSHYTPMRHIGLYAYRVKALHAFVSWPIASLEATEKLEQLRFLANGHSIHIAQALCPVPAGVDTPEDLIRVRQQLSP